MSEFASESTRSARSAPARVRIAALLRPQEHGVYGLYTEPVLLGLILAPGWAGAAIALAGAAAIVGQQPAALALADLRRGRRYPRTRVGGLLALAAGALALAALTTAALVAGVRAPGGVLSAWWAPILVALIPAGVQFAADRKLQGKTATAQISGAVALASLAPAIALAGGASALVAWGAWGWLALRVAASIPNVRARLRRARGQDARAGVARWTALALPIGAALGWAGGLLTVLPPIVAVALAGRSLWILRPGAPTVPAARVGVAETIVGLIWVAALAFGIAR